MTRGWRQTIRPALLPLTLLATLLISACARDEVFPITTSGSGDLAFSGTMIVSGTRNTLSFDKYRQATVFRLGGTASLSGTNRPTAGFRTEIIGYSDTTTGMRGSSVWTDREGNRVFSELHAAEPGPDRPVTGTIVGGTGRFAGATGEYRFTWQYMMDSDDGTVGARISDLQGSVRLATLLKEAPR